jgi:two-component system response regulator FixJ
MTRTVHIVDDDEGVRKSLKLLMSSVQLAAETYASAREFLACVGRLDGESQHCVVVDVRMPEMSGLELQEELRRRNAAIPLIVMSGYGDIPMAVRAMKAGARTFLEKPVDEQALIDEVFAALKPARDRSEGSHLVLVRHRERLTQRQRQVFDLLVRGLQTKQIAKRLGISHRTVEVHRSKILARLEATTFANLLSTVLERDLGKEGEERSGDAATG